MESKERMDLFDITTGKFEEDSGQLKQFKKDLAGYEAEREIVCRILQMHLNKADESVD